MLRRVSSLPFFVLLLGIGAVAMLVPALHAYGRSDFGTARIFLYATILGLFLSILIGLATTGYAPRSVPRSQLGTLVAAYAVLPLLFAIPFYEAARPVSFLNAWFEMVSSFTTTGATIFDNPRRINPSLHLWRA
ncbi:MAG: TrkH family potassium uptake protein, partial [Rhodobacterales bacterium]|nr:TrkH family potassium uptake protein [Rhodobacterales bacterium]